jgi:hypothetical protein
MTRTMIIATAVVLIVAVGYFVLLGANGSSMRSGDAPVAGTTASDGSGRVLSNSEAIAQDNMSNRTAGDIATDGAFENAQAGQEPVQDQVDDSRAIAGQTGAVGGSAFTVAGYDRPTVVDAILVSDLAAAEKDDLMAELEAAEPEVERLEEVLAEVRLALALEQ